MRPGFVKNLRTNVTDAEQRLWYRLRGHRFGGYKFKRQASIGRYIVDFICMDRGLVIEVDGGQLLESPSDRERDAWLAGNGLRVRRFWNDDVLKNTDGVMQVIAEDLGVLGAKPLSRRALRATLSPSGRGESKR